MIIERRFRGPPDSANGGYACGLVAGLLEGPAEVTLRSPPPLDRPLEVERTERGILVRAGAQVVAEGARATLSFEVPAPVSFEEAERASRGYPWTHGHPFPGCFVCGPERAPGDGLCIFPGPVESRSVAAAPWVPDASLAGADGRVRAEIVWSALDCPSWFGMYCFQDHAGSALLGRLAAQVLEPPRAARRYVTLGWFLARDGRKIHTGSALFSERGELHAFARATWIALPPSHGAPFGQ